MMLLEKADKYSLRGESSSSSSQNFQSNDRDWEKREGIVWLLAQASMAGVGTVWPCSAWAWQVFFDESSFDKYETVGGDQAFNK